MDGTPVDFSVDNDNEVINVLLGKTGEVAVTIEYSAKLTDTMMGIYPSYYQVNGEQKQLVGTQLKPILLDKHSHVLMNQKLRQSSN